MTVISKYHVYITTNPGKSALYIGVTNNLSERLVEHYLERGGKSFAGKYYSYNLIYFEEYNLVKRAIAREKELKSWSRKKKENLINSINPGWKFLNKEFVSRWPPGNLEGLNSSDIRCVKLKYPSPKGYFKK